MDTALQEITARLAGDRDIEALVKLRKPGIVPEGLHIVTQFGDIATCRLQVQRIQEIWGSEAVFSLKAPRQVGAEPADTQEGWHRSAEGTRQNPMEWTGEGVVVGIIDWGFDFTHPNFIDPETQQSRMLAIWDQTAPPHPSSSKWGYGRVYAKPEIDEALASANPLETLGYHPASGDPDGSGSHGTHVLDIAAGNGTVGEPGMAPKAHIVAVHLSAGNSEGNANLGDSGRILEAIDFISSIAGDRPLVINMSVGKHGGSHHGNSLVEQGMDQFLRARPGRMIVNSAGNYYSAEIHASGHLAPGQQATVEWRIGKNDLTTNELEVWYSELDRFSLRISHPHLRTKGYVLELGESQDIVHEGKVVGRAYHRANEPNTQNHHIDIFLYTAAPPGEWKVELLGNDVVDGRYHIWVERDGGCRDCQSHLSPAVVDPHFTTGTICNGLYNITVGAYDQTLADRPVAPFSSAGPTVDGRQKPNLVAPGMRIVAAKSTPAGQIRSAGEFTVKSGTSMAAPHVTGAVALLFEAAGNPLPVEDTRRAITTSLAPAPPQSDPFHYGNGYLDVEALLQPYSSPLHPKSMNTFQDTLLETADQDGASDWAEGRSKITTFPERGIVNELKIKGYSDEKGKKPIAGLSLTQGQRVDVIAEKGDLYQVEWAARPGESFWVKRDEVLVPSVRQEEVGDHIRKVLTTAGFDPTDWFGDFVSATFLGLPIADLIHKELAQHITVIEAKFIRQYGDAAKARTALDLGQMISGARIKSGTGKFSYHIFGLALDIEYTRNPYLNPRDSKSRAATNVVFAAIGHLLDNKPMQFVNVGGGNLKKAYQTIAGINDKVKLYFSLARPENAGTLEDLLLRNKTDTWHGKTVDEARTKINEDLLHCAKLWHREHNVTVVNRNGFLTHPEALVLGMELDWGGTYGDMMHFDMRNIGDVGTRIEKAKDAVMYPPKPTKRHAKEEWEAEDENEAYTLPTDWGANSGEESYEEDFDGENDFNGEDDAPDARQIGWPDADSRPAKDGNGNTVQSAGWNVGIVTQAGMRRIPIFGIEGGNREQGTKESDRMYYDSYGPYQGKTVEAAHDRAIVWLPQNMSGSQPVEILLHLHGMTIGYRQHQNGSVEDVRDMKIGDQLGDGKRAIIAILPQGSPKSQAFGGHFTCDDYIQEVLQALVHLQILRQVPTIQRKTLSAFSGGGNVVWRMLYNAKVPPGKKHDQPFFAPKAPFDLLLFDAVNQGQAPYFWEGIKPFIDRDVKQLALWTADPQRQIDYLRDSPRFRGFCTSGGYSGRYTELLQEIEQYFKALKKKKVLDADVLDALAKNYLIVLTGIGNHLKVMGNPMKNPKFDSVQALTVALEAQWEKHLLAPPHEDYAEDDEAADYENDEGPLESLEDAWEDGNEEPCSCGCGGPASSHSSNQRGERRMSRRSIRNIVREPVEHVGQHENCFECGEYYVGQLERGGGSFEGMENFSSVPASFSRGQDLRQVNWAREAYDHLALGRPSKLRASDLSGYKVIHRPGEALADALLPGDILLDRAYGTGKAHAYVLRSGEAIPQTIGGQRNIGGAGFAAEVIALQPTSPALTRVTKGIGDANGHLRRNQLVIRRVPGESNLAEKDVATLIVHVRTDFMRLSGGNLVHDWVSGSGVENAVVEIVGQGIQAVTNRAGEARLVIDGLADGNYTVNIRHQNASQNSPLDAGPALAELVAAPPARIYKPLQITVSIRSKRLTAASIAAGTRHGGIGNRTHTTWNASRLPIDWKPSWAAAPAKDGEGPRAGRLGAITGIIVHHTAGAVIGGALNTFLNQTEIASAHYLIDLNGHVIKLNKDAQRVNHAGCSKWRGVHGMNGSTIGIEIVNEDGAYPQAQYDALLALLQSLQQAYNLHLPARNIFSHADIAINKVGRNCLASGMPGRKAGDPGTEFDWTLLEQSGLGMIPDATVRLGNSYANYFATFPEALRTGDADTTQRYGGRVRTGLAATIVNDLQTDLTTIGYAVDVNGDYDAKTRAAVSMFQEHFFSGPRRSLLHGAAGAAFVQAQYNAQLGRVNQATATMIKQVLANVVAPLPAVVPAPGHP